MIQVNTKANLDNAMSIDKAMIINFTPQIGNARSNEDNSAVILPLSITCFKDEATSKNGEYQPVIPIRDGAKDENVNLRSLFGLTIEYTNEEWNSQTEVNRDTMETKLIIALEEWNPAWKGNLVKI